MVSLYCAVEKQQQETLQRQLQPLQPLPEEPEETLGTLMSSIS